MKRKISKAVAFAVITILLLTALVSCDQKDVFDLNGFNGLKGADGKSAYEIAVEKGYAGTLDEWLASLVGEAGATGQAGANGRSAYEIAVSNGYTGTETEWLTSLVGVAGANGSNGSNGANGKSAYEFACDNGFEGSLSEWLDSLVGRDGVNGTNGMNGKSAYELACENGFEGSLTEWLASLVGVTGSNGTNGKSAYELAVENGYEGTVQEWLASLVGKAGKDGANGTNGTNGKSAYELAVERGYNGDLQTWLASLVGAKGEPGKNGTDGKSAYEIAVENGYEGTEEGWIESLKGSDGEKGEQGDKGDQGVSVVNAYINSEMHLILVLSNNNEIDAGYVGVTIAPMPITHTVTFVDYDGTVLKTEIVEKGESVTAPSDPIRNGYRFLGWDKSFDNVNSDLMITALYENLYVNPTFVVDNANVNPGDIVEININLKNNPGIASLILSLEYDEEVMTLENIEYNSEIGGQTVQPQKKTSPVMLYWVNGFADTEGDWTFATLKFKISTDALQGEYVIKLSYLPDNVYDITETNIYFDIVNGIISVE